MLVKGLCLNTEGAKEQFAQIETVSAYSKTGCGRMSFTLLKLPRPHAVYPALGDPALAGRLH